MKKNIKKEENKKLYKNWKLYATALAIMLIGAGTGLGIYFGTNNHSNHSEITKINLNTLELNTTLSFPVVSQQAAFDLFIKSNATITDLKDNIEIINYNPSDYNKLGSLEIQAKENSTKYTGTIKITIPEKNKTNLNQLVSNTTIQGKENMKADDAFNAFLEANNSWSNLSDFVDYSLYTAATYTSNGSLTISAKANTAFTGNITVTINAIKLNLSTLELNTTISGTEDTTDEKFFQTFLDENKNIFGDNLTREQVELTNFNGIKIGQNGTLTITVKEGTNNKFTGSIDITLKYRLDDETIIDMMTFLSDNNQLNFQIPTGTKQSELMKLITEDFKNKLSNYYLYADDIESIDVTTPRYQPTQEQLDTKDFVWIPPKHTDQANLGISYLWLGFTVTYKDGTIKTPSQGPVDPDGYHHSNSVLIAWNLDATITMV